MQNLAMITIDVEAQPPRAPEKHIERLIYGKFGGEAYGIGKIFDIAEKFGIRTTCFLDYSGFSSYGPDYLDVARYIHDRGHDVQLHLHPEYLDPAEWQNFSGNPQSNQLYVDGDQADFLVTWMVERQMEAIGKKPVAFRGGGFRFNGNLLGALRKAGIRYNFGYNPAVENQLFFRGPMPPFNWSGTGIIEIPQPCIPAFLGTSGFTTFDFNHSLFLGQNETRSVENFARYIDQYFSLWPEGIATLLMHSWSFLKREDPYYTGAKPHAPAYFERFSSILKEKCRIVTASDLAEINFHPAESRVWRQNRYYFGRLQEGDQYTCPICGSGRDALIDNGGIPNRQCKTCKAIERHRALALLLEKPDSPVELAGKKVLYFSPSDSERKIIQKYPAAQVTTIDIRPEAKTDIIGDISDLQSIEDKSFDVIVICQVLSHVEKLPQALAELDRILKDDGILLQWDFSSPDSITGELTDIEKITNYYGKENYEKYRVGRFRYFGELDLESYFAPFFERDAHIITDPALGTTQIWNLWRKSSTPQQPLKIEIPQNQKQPEKSAENEKLPPNDQILYITSSNLQNFKSSRLYGFGIQGQNLLINCEIDAEMPVTADDVMSCCAILRVKDGKITINVDASGYGTLYLYKKGDFWAISNSYGYLVKRLRESGHGLTLNKGFAAQFLWGYCTPFSAGATLCDEIELIPAATRVEIDITDKKLELVPVQGVEPVSILSAGSMAILDRWLNKWLGIIRGLATSGVTLCNDLSGGMDSRITFALTAASGIDLNKIWINCRDSQQSEDFIIASRLAEAYGAILNANAVPSNEISYEDTLRIFDLSKRFTHVTVQGGYAAKQKYFNLTGFSGELRKDEWQINMKEWLRPIHHEYGAKLVAEGVQSLMDAAKTALLMPYIPTATSKTMIMEMLYVLSRMRWHFGVATFANIFLNRLSLSPLADPLLNQIHQDDVRDKKFLYALILLRTRFQLPYASFERSRFIHTDTFAQAAQVNRLIPFVDRHEQRDFSGWSSDPVYTYAPKAVEEDAFDRLRKCQLWNVSPVFNKHYSEKIIEQAMAAKNPFGTRSEAILAVSEFLS